MTIAAKAILTSSTPLLPGSFFEHIAEQDLPRVMSNIKWHTQPGSYLVVSISDCNSIRGGIEHHQTRQNRVWWQEFFERNGYTRDSDLEQLLDGDAWVRKTKYNYAFRRLE